MGTSRRPIFCGAVRQLLADHQAQEVKTIGDAVMSISRRGGGDPAWAVHCARRGRPARLSPGAGGHAHRPSRRARGRLVRATVNLAARVSAAAAGGEALLTAATRDAAGEVEEVELRERGRWSFRNVTEPVPVYAAVRQGHAALLGYRSTRCAGWRSTPGTVPAGPRGHRVLLLLAGVCWRLRPAPSQIRRR